MFFWVFPPHRPYPEKLDRIACDDQPRMIIELEKMDYKVDDMTSSPFELLLGTERRPDAWIELVEE